MLSYCLKCRKNTESRISKPAKQKAKEQCFYRTVWFVIVKNWELLKSKKLLIGLLRNKKSSGKNFFCMSCFF